MPVDILPQDLNGIENATLEINSDAERSITLNEAFIELEASDDSQHLSEYNLVSFFDIPETTSISLASHHKSTKNIRPVDYDSSSENEEFNITNTIPKANICKRHTSDSSFFLEKMNLVLSDNDWNEDDDANKELDVVGNIGKQKPKKCSKKTLDISQMTLRYAVQKSVQKSAKPDQRGKHPPHNKTPIEIKKSVHNFIKKLPAVPPHYSQSRNDRENLLNDLRNVSFLYRIFPRDLKETGSA
ncbi:hypothetical protein ILUMI_12738, partial [Ignelater luminosus]